MVNNEACLTGRFFVSILLLVSIFVKVLPFFLYTYRYVFNGCCILNSAQCHFCFNPESFTTDGGCKLGMASMQLSSQEIQKLRQSRVGKTMRTPASNTARQALTWNPHGERERSRSPNTWHRDLEADIMTVRLTWSQLERRAQEPKDACLTACVPVSASTLNIYFIY